MEEKIKAYIDQIRPYIQSHGGDVEYIALDGKTVKLRLLGSCRSCPSAVITLHQGIEAQLKEAINPELVVQRVQ